MKKLIIVCSAVSSFALSVPAFAADITVDYSTMATGLTSQATTAITAALPVLGAILGVVVGVKLFRRFAK